VLVPLAHCRNAIASEGHLLSFYKHVSANPALRQASRDAKSAINYLETEIGMRQDLRVLVNAVAESKTELDHESKRLLDFERRNFFRNGLGIAQGPLRDRFREIKERLSELPIEFRRNMNEEHRYVAFSLEELEGMSRDFLQRLEPDHNSAGAMVKLRVSFKMNYQQPLLRYADLGETRKR